MVVRRTVREDQRPDRFSIFEHLHARRDGLEIGGRERSGQSGDGYDQDSDLADG